MSVDCADPCRVRAGDSITFTDTSSGAVRFRTWDFAGGGRRTSPTVRHSWSEPGFYEAALLVSDGVTESTASRTFLVESSAPAGDCQPDRETRCLLDSRYSVRVDWWNSGGLANAASVVHAGTNDSAMFWFFAPSNWEVLIKVLDGCSLNGRVWVFGASTTDVGYRIAVTDTVTGVVREYRNEPGRPAAAITDSAAFAAVCAP